MPTPINVIQEASVLWLKSRSQRHPLRRELPLSHPLALENAGHRLFDTGEPLVPRRTRSDHYTPRALVGKEATRTFIQTIKVLDPCPEKVVQRSDLLATHGVSMKMPRHAAKISPTKSGMASLEGDSKPTRREFIRGAAGASVLLAGSNVAAWADH